MSRKCRLPGRNLCAPNGKIAALFVDIDGTVSKCEPYFRDAKRRFGFYMQRCGFNRTRAMKLMADLELEHIHKHGFERDALAIAMTKAYRQLCREKGVRANKNDVGICWDIGRSPFFREPELFPNAAAVLNRAHHNFYLVAVSIGNREAQKYKIRMAGLDAIFDHIIITQQDNKSELVAGAIEDLKIDPRYSAFIGNSVRSDGQCLKNTNFIHMPLEGWTFDHAELPQGTGFEYFNVNDWREAEEKGISRLLLRRQVAMESETGSGCDQPTVDNPRPAAASANRKPRRRSRG